MPYFLKTTVTGSQWSWAFAAKVARTASGVTCAHIRVPNWPLLTPDDNAVLFGDKHVWEGKSDCVLAYPYPAVDWLGGTTQSSDPNIPNWVPEALRVQGLGASIEYALKRSGMLRHFEPEHIRRAVAEDKVLDELAPIIYTPHFLPPEDKLIVEWGIHRAACQSKAIEDAKRVADACAGSDAVKEFRKRLRLEAHRKLDSRRDEMMTTPSLGGEPWMRVNNNHLAVQLGRVKRANYAVGENAEAYHSYFGNEAALQSLEDAIVPGGLDWNERLSTYKLRVTFNAWDEMYPYPSINYRHWASGDVPKGLVRREGMKGAPQDYATMGIISVLSEPAFNHVANLNLNVPTPFEAACYCLKRAWASA